MNWLDAVIIIVILFFVISGLRRGFLGGLLELIGIVLAVSISLFSYIPAGKLLEHLGISQVYSGALAFLIIFVITISIYFSFAEKLYRLAPRILRTSLINRIFGSLTGFIKGLLAAALLFTLIVALPLPFVTSEDIEKSNFTTPLLNASTTAASLTANIFGEALHHTLGFLTINIDADEIIDLKLTDADTVINKEAESEMLLLVNEERAKRGLPELVLDETLSEAARKHSIDMFQKGYFGHIDPEGNTPFDRIKESGVSFNAAGENLALAHTVTIAHKGLMNSPGHRENILHPGFTRIGIGAAQSSKHGIMFTQKFAN